MKEFGASSEAEKVAARAAGQDAGAAGLAVMSWALWVLGHIDKAVARMGDALQRAEAVKDPHTQAYVCYYASILHALRGEPAAAHAVCRTLSHVIGRTGFRQWRGLSRAIHATCAAVLDPSSAVDHVIIGWDEYRRAGYQFGITALLALLCEALFFEVSSTLYRKSSSRHSRHATSTLSGFLKRTVPIEGPGNASRQGA